MKKLWFIVFLLFSFQQWVVAQEVYSPACFTLEKTSFCVNEEVKVDDNCYIKLDKTYIDPPIYFFNFGNSPDSTISKSHSYSKPGSYKITQIAGKKPGGAVDSKTIIVTVHEPTIPEFTVQTCEDRKVIVQIQTQSNQPFKVNLGDGTEASTTGNNPVTHIYSDNSTKQIKIKGMCTSESDPKNVTPLDFLYPPAITKFIKDKITSEAIIEFNGFANHKYKIYQQINGGAFDSIGSITDKGGLITFTQKLPNPDDQYCYYVSAYDACSAKNSDTICSFLATATAGNNVNTINWNSPSANSYSLTINGISTIPDGPASHDDQNVTCGSKYFYNITAHQNNSLGQPLENTIRLKPVTGISTTTPTAVQNLNATISGSSAKLTWESPTNFTVASYKIFRSVSQSTFTQIATSISNSYTDPNLAFSKDYYCYKIIYEDACGNVSLESDITCPIILRVNKEQSEGSNEENNLNLAFWNRYHGSAIPSGFILEKLDEKNNVIETISLSDTSYLDSNIDPTTMLIRYRIKVPYGTGEFYYSNIFEVRNEIKIFAPDIFTPNADNQNDVFFVYGKYFKDFELSIFNRWGEMVFNSNDIEEGWDGTFLGQPVPVDDYTFVINAKDNKDNLTVKKGMVTLMR